MQERTNSRKVLLIGWDAADWKVISPMMDAGKMPNVERLVNRGVMTSLATLHPPFSPILWTSIATGKRPFKHGVLGFSEPTPDGRGVQPVTNLSRKTKAIWNILTQESYRSNVIGWWPSHPAEPIRGAMVSNHYQRANAPMDKPWPMRPGTVHPERLSKTLGKLRLHPEELGEEDLLPFIPRAAEIDQEQDPRLASMARILADCSTVHSAATHLIEHEPWDFMAVYYDAIDHFSHGFMKYHPPRQRQISVRDFDLYSGVIEAGYRFHDMMLGRLLKFAGPETTVILMSDHGFHPDHLRPKAIPLEPAGPAVEHRDFGILVIAGPDIKKDELIHGANLLDICPTVLTLFGLPVGRDMDGKPLVEAWETPPEVPSIESWDEVEGNAGRHPPERTLHPFESKEALDQLVALGYIDQPDENADKAVENTVRELRYNLAMAYMDCDRHSEAAEILRELYEKEPDQHRFGIHLAMCCRALERAVELKELVVTLGVRRRQDAIESRAKLAKWKKEIAKRKRERGEGAADKKPGGGEDDALLTQQEQRELRDLQGRARVNPFALDYLMGFALAAEGKDKEALASLERARKAEPRRPGLHIQIGEVYLMMERWREAEGAFQRAYHIDPDNPHAHLGMARALLARRKNRMAAEEALKAAGLLYRYPMAHYVLGVALHRMGRVRRAVEALEVAVTLNPNFPEAHRRLARIYEKRLEDPKRAAQHRRQAGEATVGVQAARKTRRRGGDRAQARQSARAAMRAAPPAAADRAERITIVSGLPRSGTSLMMRMLAAGGLDILTDGVRVADEDNPNGYYEFEPVKRTRRDAKWLDDAKGKAVKMVHLLLYDLPPDRHYDVILMRRDMDEVLASQRKMLVRRGREGGKIDDARMRRVLEQQLVQVMAHLQSRPNVRFIGIDYNALVEDSGPEIARLREFLGLEASATDLAETVDPSLWRNRAGVVDSRI